MLERKSNFKAWMYLAPSLILLTVFTFYPLINAFLISFFGDVIIEDMSTSGFVGLRNYIERAHFEDNPPVHHI